MADVGVAAVHHDLDAVAAAVLVAVADEPHVAGGVVGFEIEVLAIVRLSVVDSPLRIRAGRAGGAASCDAAQRLRLLTAR